jgi:hypothetical protein
MFVRHCFGGNLERLWTSKRTNSDDVTFGRNLIFELDESKSSETYEKTSKLTCLY